MGCSCVLMRSWAVWGPSWASRGDLSAIRGPLGSSGRPHGEALGHLGMSYELLKVFFVIFDVPNLLFLRDSSSEMLTLKKSESIKKTLKKQ